MQTKKGFIMIYTVLVGIICLIIMMYIFDIQMAEVEYSQSNKTFVLKDNNYQRQKEYLMTAFFTYITENDDEIKASGIEQFFFDSIGDIVTYKNTKVSYSNKSQEFIFITPFNTTKNRNDYFKLIANGESFKTIFIKTEYNLK